MRHRSTLVAGATALALLGSVAVGCTNSPVATSPTTSQAGGSPNAPRSTQPSAQRPPGDRPNVVFVLTDDLDTSLLRYMPHVQQMQREGVNFTNYSVTDSLCCPSRASIFSGKVPHNTGVFTNKPPDGGFPVFHRRGEERSTFATALQSAGYHTAMMGKYLNGYKPKRKLGGSRPYVPPGWNEWDVAGNGYPEYNYTLNETGRPVHYGHRPKDYLTDVISDKGQSFIRDQAAAGNPFLLELATFAPHGPYTPAPRDKKAFPGLKAPRDPSYNEADTGDKPSWLRDHPELKPKQQHKIDRVYRKRAQAVQAVDDMLANLQKTLRSTGQADNTYVVFSSDNGYHLGQHRLASGKQTAFDTDVHVPLVATGPGVPAGRTAAQPTANIDLCPTFSQIGGAAAPRGVDGQSLLPLLHGQPAPGWRQASLVEHHGPNNKKGDPDRQRKAAGNPPTYEALRAPTTTYVEYRNGDREYYDRRRDPYELTNSYASLPEAERNRLHEQLRAMSRCHGAAECTRATR